MRIFLYNEITEALTNVALFYQHSLYKTPEALKYCYDRGISDRDIKTFGIGYSPGIQLLEAFALMNSIPQEALEQSLNFRFSKDPYDKFTDRIVFPIYDLLGSVVGFSGRIWREGDFTAKYINSPSSYIFKKSFFLYGLYQALSAIQQYGYVVIVEGNVDVVSASRAGISNVVAPCGTALRLSQILILKNFTNTIVGCFDSDSAGIGAVSKLRELCNSAGCILYSVTLSGAKDPDEYIQKFGADRFRQSIEEVLQ